MNPVLVRLLPTFAIAPLIVSLPQQAQAGNDEGILLGNEAAMTGGAVTATSTAAAGMWYNPSALINYDARQLDVGGTGFQMRIYGTGGPLALPDGTQAEQTVQDRAFVPNALAITLPLRGGQYAQRIGFGVFSTQYESSLVQSRLSVPSDTNADGETSALLVSQTRARLHHIPVAYAIRVLPQLTLGASTQLVIRQLRNTYDFTLQEDLTGNGELTAYEQRSTAANDVGVGLRASLGLQWRPVEELSFGLSLLTPSRIILNIDSQSNAETQLDGTLSGENAQSENFEFVFERYEHMRLRLAAAHLFDRGWIAIEMDVATGRSNDFLEQHTATVANFRVGGMYAVSPMFTLGAGVFSDQEATLGPYLPNEYRVDYYGGTLGVQYSNRSSARGNFVYSVTLAPRYAYGQGSQGVIIIDPASPASTAGVQPMRAVIHEVGVHLGTSLSW